MWHFHDSENKRGLDLNDLEKSRYHLSEVDEKHVESCNSVAMVSSSML